MKAAEPGGNGRMSGDRLGAGLGVGLAAFVVFGEKACGAFGECVGLADLGPESRAKPRRRGGAKGAKGNGAVIRSGVFGWLMAAGPIERNFIPHSTTLARGRMSGNRLGAGLGVGLAAFGFGANASGAFGECVRVGDGNLARGRGGAEARRKPVFGQD